MADKKVEAARDIPGRKREYETIYILHPDTNNEVISGLNAKVRSIIETGSGNLLKVTNWGRRRLAYVIAKQSRGIYLFFNYLGTPGLVDEVERHLRHADSVIRFYSVKTAENVDPAVRTSDVTDESFAGAAVPAEAEEESVSMGQSGSRGEEYEEAGFSFEEAVFGTSTQPQRRNS